MKRKIALIVCIAILIAIHCKPNVTPPEPFKVIEPKVSQMGDRSGTQGGTYDGHTWDGFSLTLNIKFERTIHCFIIGPAATITMIDQRTDTRAKMSPSQMADWLSQNKSEKICNMVGFEKGRVMVKVAPTLAERGLATAGRPRGQARRLPEGLAGVE